MKIVRKILKWVVLCMCVAAAVCTVIAYWDKISNAFRALAKKCPGKKRVSCSVPEYEDFADFEEWSDSESAETL